MYFKFVSKSIDIFSWFDRLMLSRFKVCSLNNSPFVEEIVLWLTILPPVNPKAPI